MRLFLAGLFRPERWMWLGAALMFLLSLAGCGVPAAEAVTATATREVILTPAATQTVSASPTPSPTSTPLPTAVVPESTPVTPTAQPTITPSPTSDLRLSPEQWQIWPVIPTLSARAQQVLKAGLAKGNSARAFAKVGDCETSTDWFLADFDRGRRFYDLGTFTALQKVIDYYAGSFQRKSAASARGFTAASALTAMWADPKVCLVNETPLACEYRLHKPAVVLIMLGTNDVNHKSTFEANLRKILDQTLERGILPVLVTKADNLEGDQLLNLTMVRLAYEYDLPVWNFWLAVQGLPGNGLQPDGAHLTHAPNKFSDPVALLSAWPVRNLTALQVLAVIMQAGQSPVQ